MSSLITILLSLVYLFIGAYIYRADDYKMPWYVYILWGPLTLFGLMIYFWIDILAITGMFNFKDINRKVKYTYQRLTKGYSDDQCFNLGWHIVKFVSPRIKRLMEFDNSFTPFFDENGIQDPNSYKRWREVLYKIDKACDLCISEEDPSSPLLTNENRKEMQEGFELLGKYLTNLWD